MMKENRKIKLVRQIIYKRNNPEYSEMDELCFKSKNLYNATLYEVRQSFIKSNEYLNYNRINKIFTKENNPDYRALPSKVAKHTQMFVDFAMKSFFALVKKKKDKGYEKKVKLPKEEIYQMADELKVVIFNNHDFKFAEEQAAKVSEKCKLYLQSEWSKREQNYPKITDYILQHPKWIASVQTHKYLNIP